MLVSEYLAFRAKRMAVVQMQLPLGLPLEAVPVTQKQGWLDRLLKRRRRVRGWQYLIDGVLWKTLIMVPYPPYMVEYENPDYVIEKLMKDMKSMAESIREGAKCYR